MSGEINVISRTQVINVDEASQSVSIINAGPAGPAGITGTAIWVGSSPPSAPGIGDLWIDTGGGVGSVATHFLVEIPSSAEVDEMIMVTVTALDADDNVVPGYAGIVTFDSDAPVPTPFILDMDHGIDIDDHLDLAIVCELVNNGFFKLLAITSTWQDTVGAGKHVGSIDTVVTHMDVSPVPVYGVRKTAPAVNGPDNYSSYAYDHFIHPHVGLATTVPDAIDVLRQTLHDSPVPVWIIATGPVHNLYDLLFSSADSIDSRNGHDLLVAKCAGCVWVAGFPFEPTATGSSVVAGLDMAPFDAPGGEYNIYGADPTQATAFLAGWPVGSRLICCPISLGNHFSDGQTLDTDLPSTCVVRDVYDHYCTVVSASPSAGRPAWSPPAFDYFAHPSRWSTFRGTWSFTSTGTAHDTFAFSETGPHEILVRLEYADDFTDFFNADLVAHGV